MNTSRNEKRDPLILPKANLLEWKKIVCRDANKAQFQKEDEDQKRVSFKAEVKLFAHVKITAKKSS